MEGEHDGARPWEQEGWAPAWKRWSKQVVRPGKGDGGIVIDLVPPLVASEEAEQEDRGRSEWEEEELEAFLQQCEVEAGLREELDIDEVKRASESWRRLEAETTMAGIACPRLDEPVGGLGARSANAVEREEESMADSYQPPPVGQRREANQGSGQQKKRQRFRPLTLQSREGDPVLEELRTAVVEAALDEPVPVQPRPQRTSQRRPRGRRQRGGPPEDFAVDIITFNGSGTPQAIAALESLRPSSRRLAAVMVQEHLAKGDAVADLQHAAKAVGFKLAPSEAAVGTGGGPSAGVAIAVPLHRGWGAIHGPCWDLSPAGSPGRLVGAWVQAGPRGGFIGLSMYLWTSEGMTSRNISLVEAALGVASTCGCAWVIGADWNVTPKELREAAGGMMDRAGAVVRAPSEATCHPAVGRPRVLDFFLVDARMAAAVSEATLEQAVAGSPHRAVRITVRGKEVGGLVQVVKKPRALPRERPTGCPRRPLVPGGREAEGNGGEPRDLEEAWRGIAYCIEAELCRECDYVHADGAPDARYMGRGEGLRLVWRPLMPPRVMARHGRADGLLHRLMWSLNRLEELVHLAARGGRRVGS